jgi:DNA replication and repair protein RecF
VIFHSLRTASFRNLEDSESYTGEKNIFLVGENGQGKTNFLESLYFAAFGSSFRGVRDTDLARNGEKDFAVHAKIVSGYGKNADSSPDEVLIKYEKGKKVLFINRKKVEDRRELLSLAPCVVFCHEDMEFVSGGPERRRWFFDQSLSLRDGLYLDGLRSYRQVLKSRNAVLREYALFHRPPAPGILDALDSQLVSYGLKLMEGREREASLFSGLFGPLFLEVAGIGGLSVRYSPSWKFSGEEEGISFLAERREGDLAAGISLSGPHRDRYAFYRGSGEFTSQASTGQRRLLALLLRTAQARRFSETTGKNPVLLLDDVLLEMDGEKRRRFLSVMPVYDQAFYTFLPGEPYGCYGQGGRALVYQVESGALRPGPGEEP